MDSRASTKACHHLLLPPVEYQAVCGYCLVTRTRVALSPGASSDDQNKKKHSLMLGKTWHHLLLDNWIMMEAQTHF